MTKVCSINALYFWLKYEYVVSVIELLRYFYVLFVSLWNTYLFVKRFAFFVVSFTIVDDFNVLSIIKIVGGQWFYPLF